MLVFLLTDPLSCKALREVLTTGVGSSAFYRKVHKYLRSSPSAIPSGACLHYTPGQ
jgi:hypothetical protein